MAGCLLWRHKLSIVFFFSNIVLDASLMLHYDKLKLGELPPGCARVAFKIKSTPLRVKCYTYFHTISGNLPSTKKNILQIYNVSSHNWFLFYCGCEDEPLCLFPWQDTWAFRGRLVQGERISLWTLRSINANAEGWLWLSESGHPATVAKPLMCLLQQ